MSFWASIRPIVAEADIILLVIDARMPELSLNEELENLVNQYRKRLIFVFNKIDLLSPKVLSELRKKHPDAFFVSGTKNIGFGKLREEAMIYGRRNNRFPVKIGVVGYPNVGKSAIINCFARRARAIVSSIAGTTKGPQFVKVSKHIRLIDSPGVIHFRDSEAKLGLINAKNPEKLRNPERVAYGIVSDLMQKNRKSLEESYNIDLSKIEEPYDAFLAIGQKKGNLKKGGVIDEIKTSIEIIRDWQRGKIRVL